MGVTELFDLAELSDEQVKAHWEAAYLRFESQEAETRKFLSRLKKLGAREWARESEIVEIFCGRGNGLKALESLGFTRLEGVDLSPELIKLYDGPARMYNADCRDLPFEDASRDIIIVQGGLHHLCVLPDDLERVLSEVCRVLRPDGRFIVVEPWLTDFLRLVHVLSANDLVRALSVKADALAAMIHYESPTYFRWLEAGPSILKLLEGRFRVLRMWRRFGKINFIGCPRTGNS